MLKYFIFIIFLLLQNFIFAQQNVYSDLKNIKQEIDKVSLKLQKKEDEKVLIKSQIKNTYSKIKSIEDQIAKIKQDQNEKLKDLQKMQQELSALELNIENMQANLSRLLNSQYRLSQPLALLLMLENIDPNEKGRKIQYLKYIQDSNLKEIEDLEYQKIKSLNHKKLIDDQIKSLSGIIDKKNSLLLELNSKQDNQVKQSEIVDDEIKNFFIQLNKLKFNETKLNALIRTLSKVDSKKGTKINKTRKSILNNDINKDNKFTSIFNIKSSFSKQQGKLNLPTDGVITGFFGTPRSGLGSGVWGGIFIKSNYSNVYSVYNGEIVYAGYLNGYGNTIVIDNHDYYLTIYSGLSKIDVTVGNKIHKGTKIGVTGIFPGVGEGLYFEIRYQYVQLNPINWFKN